MHKTITVTHTKFQYDQCNLKKNILLLQKLMQYNNKNNHTSTSTTTTNSTIIITTTTTTSFNSHFAAESRLIDSFLSYSISSDTEPFEINNTGWFFTG